MNLFRHQLEACQFAVKQNGNCAIIHEMGLGKTRTGLEIFKFFRHGEKLEGRNLNLLVIAPLSLLEGAWGMDIQKFAPELRYLNLHEEEVPTEQLGYWLRKFRVWLINYEALLSKKNLLPLALVLRQYNFMAIVDESSRMKSHDTLTSKTLLKLRDLFKYRIVMSGTPAPNVETEFWAQMEFVKPDLLGTSFYKFRNTYFHLQRGSQTMPAPTASFMTRKAAHEIFSKGWKYAITERNRQMLMEQIKPYCHFAKKKDCLDLPEQVDEVRYVELSPEQKKCYREMKEQLVTEINGAEISVQVALAKLMKLRQITGGFSYDERHEPHPIPGASKMRELLSVLEEAGEQQVIIWIQFHWEVLAVASILLATGKYKEDQIVTLYGNTKDRDGSVRAFMNGEARILIANPHSAGHGLTFVGCSLEVFYSMDYSFEMYEQARARIHRAGQVNKCTYVHLLTRGTIDQEVLDIVQRKKTQEQIIAEYLKLAAI